MDDALVLGFNPWEMDDSPYVTLADRFIVIRKPSACAICFEAIAAGTRVRAKTEAYDGKAMTFRFCPTCCHAMTRVRRARNVSDEVAIDRRYEIGRKNAERKRRDLRDRTGE